ncbi:MAG: pseudouridine synthase [Oscillospiraceae bacterium]
MLNKPRGIRHHPFRRAPQNGGGTGGGLRPESVPVGRLDKDSEGSLLFTNDGALAQQPHPGIRWTKSIR